MTRRACRMVIAHVRSDRPQLLTTTEMDQVTGLLLLASLPFRVLGKLARAIGDDVMVVVGLKGRGSMAEMWWR